MAEVLALAEKLSLVGRPGTDHQQHLGLAAGTFKKRAIFIETVQAAVSDAARQPEEHHGSLVPGRRTVSLFQGQLAQEFEAAAARGVILWPRRLSFLSTEFCGGRG